jgi:hypothetical protein
VHFGYQEAGREPKPDRVGIQHYITLISTYTQKSISGYSICLTHHLPKVMLVTTFFKIQIDIVKGGNPLKIFVSWGFKVLKRSTGMSPTFAFNQNK